MKSTSTPVSFSGYLAGSPRHIRTIACLSLALTMAANAFAGDGTWTNQPGGSGTSATGTWNVAGNWASSTIADGSGSTAYFDTLNISGIATNNNVITMGADRTIGNIVFGNTNTATPGSWNVSGNTITLDGGTPTITVNNLGTNAFARINSVVAGSSGLTKTGAGVLVLAGSNTYTGTTTVNQGTLRILNANAVNGNINLAAGSLNFDSVTLTLNGNITGAGSVSKTNNSSVVTLAGNNDFTGGVTLSDGVIALGSGTNNGLGTGTLSLGSGTLRSSDNNARTITNNLAFTGSGSYRFGAALDATTSLGDLTFTYAGTTSLGASRGFTVDNATVVTFNNNFTANSGWNVSKSGTGTLVFNGNFGGSFNGTVTVNKGTLILNGTKGGGGAVTVNSGGVLGGSGNLTGATTVNLGGGIAPGNSIGNLTLASLTWNGETNIGGGEFAQFMFELGSSNASDAITMSGALTKGTGEVFKFDFLDTGVADSTYTLITFSGTSFSLGDFSYTGLNSSLTGSFVLNAGSLQFVTSAVPEPGMFAALAGLGVLALGVIRRRRR